MIRSIAVETSPPPPMSTLFPYTTLFRSLGVANLELLALEVDRRARRRQPRRAGRGGRLVALRWAGGEAARCVGQHVVAMRGEPVAVPVPLVAVIGRIAGGLPFVLVVAEAVQQHDQRVSTGRTRRRGCRKTQVD